MNVALTMNCLSKFLYLGPGKDLEILLLIMIIKENQLLHPKDKKENIHTMEQQDKLTLLINLFLMVCICLLERMEVIFIQIKIILSWLLDNFGQIITSICLSFDYLKHYLDALNLVKLGLIKGIAVPKLNQHDLNSILVAIPPEEQQDKIVKKIKVLLSALVKF